MKENCYTLLMRKYILGIASEEEEDLLFDWLDQDDKRFNFLTWFSAWVLTADDPRAQQALTWKPPHDNQCTMTAEECDLIMARLWQHKAQMG